jgi:plasmid stabilization system protein ParE
MAFKVEISPLAEADADETFFWIAKDSPRNAERWYRGLIEKLQTLSTDPESHPIAPDSDAFAEDVRQLLYGKRRGVHRILFAIRGEIVYVLRILHGARKLLRE